MILANAAPRYTVVPPSSTATAIVSGETIRVHGILFVASVNATVTMLDNSGATIAVVGVLANDSFELKTGFIADKGLKITTDSNATCVVFHSQGAV